MIDSLFLLDVSISLNKHSEYNISNSRFDSVNNYWLLENIWVPLKLVGYLVGYFRSSNVRFWSAFSYSISNRYCLMLL